MEKPPYPETKIRMIFSVIGILVGLFLAYGVEFEGNLIVGWILVAMAVFGVIYNIYCMKIGRKY